jgi:Protein of unknown function (DUF742)
MPPGGAWRRKDSGRVVRPYAITGGRTVPADGEVLDLVAIVVATGQQADAEERKELTPEHRRIITLCRDQLTVADLGVELGLPVGVIRVLLADLIATGAIAVVPQRPAGERTNDDVLQGILKGLRAL